MHLPDTLKLVGVAVVVVGLALRLRTTLVVVTAGVVTGLLSGLPLLTGGASLPGGVATAGAAQEGIVNMLGRAFVENRLMILFIITLPAIGLAERYGLQEEAARLIRRISAATVGRLLVVYQLFRVLMGILGIRLSGHPAFVRPLVFPMSLGAAEAEAGARGVESLPVRDIETIKAADSASENYGNFYGQNLSPVQPGVLLVFGVLKGLGYAIDIWRLVLYAIPVAAISVVLGAIQFRLLDARLRRSLNAKR